MMPARRRGFDTMKAPRGRWIALVCVLATISGCTSFKRWLYEGFNRDEWQHREQVIQALRLHPGDVVADLGSGSGYFTFHLAKAVGSSGKVFAVDLDADLNAYVETHAREEGATNIEVRLAEPDDPLLPEGSVDLIFTCITYHHLKDRVSYFKKVGKALRAGGRIAIIDFNEKAWLEMLIGHWTPSEVLHREMKEAGYALEQELHFLPKQDFIIFSGGPRKAEQPANLTAPSTKRKSDAELLRTIHEGRPNMPVWKHLLSEQEIRDVLAYVRTLTR
jgi:arsenite methyltransferase